MVHTANYLKKRLKTKNFMNKGVIKISALLMAIMALFSACQTSRSMLKNPLKKQGAEYLLNQMQRSELDFSYLDFKASVDVIQDDKKQGFQARVRIKKDSIIWLSISPLLGIEVARLELTQDSVRFMNRIDKTWFAGDYSLINKFLETSVDFDIVQALILGNDFSYYEKSTFKTDIDNHEYKLATAKRHKLKKYVRNKADAERVFLHTIWLNPDNFKITRIKLKEAVQKPKKISAEYSDFEYVQGQLFPTKVSFNVQAETKTFIDLSFSGIKINEELNFPFKISSKYKELILED